MLGAISNRLARENRTHVTHGDGRPENVAEHVHMLTRVALHIAAQLYPDLNAADISLFSLIHDDLEAYIGDTPTHELTQEISDDKAVREEAALNQLSKDFAGLPSYVAAINAYEKQEQPEARFVRVVDKLMPLLTNIVSGGTALADHWTKDDLMNNVNTKNKKLLKDYPEYSAVLDLRTELKVVAAERLFD